MSQRKITDLKDMVIKEVSLVIDPASPGADVILTKARDVSDEPRDQRGRWTTTTAAARAHAKVLSGHAKRMAVAAFNQVKGSSIAITSTRPHGAKPVHGGGVQFEFRHTLSDGQRYISSVQIRPEHLDRAMGVPAEGQPPSRLHRALAAIHTALSRAGVAAQRPYGTPPQAGERGFGGILRVAQHPLTAAEQEEKSFQARLAQVRLLRQRDEEMRRVSGGAQGYTSAGTPANIASAVAANNHALPASQGIKGSGHGGIPTYQEPAMQPPQALSGAPPVGHGKREEVMGAQVQVPLKSSNAREARSWPYYTPEGDFIPGGRADVQEHMEDVARWRRSDGRAPSTIASMTNSHQKVARDATGRGAAYFTHEGDYVPAGNSDLQRRYETRYENEHYRLAKGDPDEGESPEQQRLAAVREPSPHRLFDNGRGQQVTEDMVRRMPDDPRLEAARAGAGQRAPWQVNKGAGGVQPLNFYTASPSPQKVRAARLAYVKSVTKSKLSA